MDLTWHEAKNILCVRLDAMGDVLMTTPAIRAIKEYSQERRITLLTSPSGAAIASLIPEVDEVIVYDAPWIKATAPRDNSQPEFKIVERLRQAKFDAAVIFTVYSQNPLPSAFLCYMADIPLRLAHCHENPYQLLTNWIIDLEPAGGIRHEVRRQLDLVAVVGCKPRNERMSIIVSREARQQVLEILQILKIDLMKPWLVIHPGASAPSRRYPPEKFAKVAQLLLLKGFQIVFTGTEPEQKLVNSITSAIELPTYSLAGCLDLAEMAALIKIAPLLISNNTGPVHIASAVGTPVVDIYALTNPQHTPWKVPHKVLYHDVPCKYCYKSICPEKHHHCLELLEPEEVANTAIELFDDVHCFGRI